MKNFAIIGAGQLGSRHLQGMIKYKKQPIRIYVIDPSLDSLNISKLRANEIEHNHQILFQQDLNSLPVSFEIIIVATNADVREMVIEQLLLKFKVKFLILEKVLFTDILAYQRVSELLKTNSVKTWVNHPRRMFSSYLSLKAQLGDSFTGTFQLTGGNWGLGCNGLHFVDLFEYLSGSRIESLDAEWIDLELHESKRKGFIEFTGAIKGKLANGSNFQITSLKGEPSVGTISIFDSENRFIIQESGIPAIYQMKKSDGFKQSNIPFTMEFQSSLSAKLLEDLMLTGSCDLPTYEDAKHTHLLFMSALLQTYCRIQNTDTHILPIT